VREGHRVTITVTIEDVHTRLEWAKAYAEQGRSDLELAPAVDREKMPHNVEYPWSDGVRIAVPCRSRFAIESLPKTSIPGFVGILKEVSAHILAA
jgi:hypothetical protein